jgi:hypothetical protein
MTLSEKIFALHALPPLAELGESELAVIAEIARERRFAPGAPVFAAGSVPPRLLFVISGSIVDTDGADQGSVPGAVPLLLELPLSRPWLAGPREGALCLKVARGHLFTIVQQCPAFVVGLLGERTARALKP